MSTPIERIETRDLAAREAIFHAIDAFNDATTKLTEPVQWLGLLLREPGSERVIGGLWGVSYYSWLFVELLFVPESLRGQGMGTRLICQAEEVARERGCIGLWLDTFSFQAPGFYEKLGFRRVGTIEDYPPGNRRFFYSKRLDTAG